MLEKKFIKDILKKKRPKPKSKWFGEPNLGSFYDKKEIDAVVKALEKSKHWSIGFGPNPLEVKKFEGNFARYCGTKYAIAVSNNGDGFDMVLNTLNLKPNDEVIAPALNFKAWHMVLLRYRCKCIFVDIDPKTLNIDLSDLEKKITKKTKVILPVHLTGLSCDMDSIDELAKNYSRKNKNKIYVIYDSARAAGGNYKNRKIGTGGYCEIFSFHTAKPMTTMGEGGMITTDSDYLAKELNQMRSYGGEESWGMNYRMSKLQAVFGIEQIKKLNRSNNLRRKNSKRRDSNLKGCEKFILPKDTNYSKNIYYMYPLMLSSDYNESQRDKLANILEKKYRIVCSVPKFINKRWKYIQNKFGVPNLKHTKFVTDRLLCPIMHSQINEEQENYISSALIDSVNKIK
jgi:perosamine synthetase|tara:strand:- start:7591 stop:8790 length:1200 start_codon:yes stop_codon:yes gene_type:complete